MVVLEIADYRNFTRVYDDMVLQFPESELKSFEKFISLMKNSDYKLILASDAGKYIGYIMVFFDGADKYLWLDYIAVFKEYHSCGYGGKMLDALGNLFPHTDGVFLEVEKPDVTQENTLRRIKFYKKHGAVLVNNNYLYPNAEGFLPMDLYYIPYKTVIPAKKMIFNVIKNVFDVLHKDLQHKDYVYNLIVNESRDSDAD